MLFDFYYEFKIGKRLKEIKETLNDFFGFPVRLKKLSQSSSKNSIYFVISNKKILAIVKVKNEFRIRKISGNYNTFKENLNQAYKHFQTEWDKCTKAFPYSLAPKPLYKNSGFIVTEYIDAPSALEIIQKDFNKFEKIIDIVVANLKKLHQIGIIHGDTALYNCLLPGEGKCIFIDLEDQGPCFKSYAKNLVFEYLHLAYSTIKFLPRRYRKIDPWIKVFNEHIGPEAKGIDITVFKEKFYSLNDIDPDFKKLKKVFR